MGGDSLRFYKYYSRMIDARLASGYLTSRPGLYAAPRLLQVGQKLAGRFDRLLRRAGYVQSGGSNVWSGSFRESAVAIEIRPNPNQTRSGLVTITFDGDKKISELTDDGISIDSFKLEPEVLSNDPLSKAGKREAVRFSEIPPDLLHAILATEDRRFFQHSGVDVFGIARALLHNAGEDRPGQGGSTITQQLVKNTYLTPERTLRRKYAEAMLSYALERRLSKEDIFALYCNEVYLGQRDAVTVRGVEEAARIYFGKELKNLSLAEAATIAGMIQGPMRFSPLHHPETSQARRNVVLEAMARDGWIDADQVALTVNEPVLVTASSHPENSLAPYFVDYVMNCRFPARCLTRQPENLHNYRSDLQQLRGGAPDANSNISAKFIRTSLPSRKRRSLRSTPRPATCWRWSAVAITRNRNSTARPTRDASPVQLSSHLSTPLPSKMECLRYKCSPTRHANSSTTATGLIDRQTLAAAIRCGT